MDKNDLSNKAVSLMKERDSLNKQVKKLTLENKKLTKQLILSGVVQPKANSSIIKPVCVCDEMTKEGISSWWCEACKTDWV